MTIFWPSTHPSSRSLLPERVEQGRSIGRGRQTKKTYPKHLSRLLRVGGERRKSETDSQNDPEPDQPHEHLGEDGWRESSRTP